MPNISEVFIMDVSDEAIIEIITYELEKWLEQKNYAENKLKNKFNKR